MVRMLSPEKKTIFLDSALRLFAARGVQNTSTAEIAKEAGTAAGTLFLYFPTRQDLLNELVVRIGNEQSNAIRGLLKPDLSARETFYVIWRGSIQWFLENMDAYQYVQQVRDTGMISETAVQESAQSLSYFFEAIQKGLEEASINAYPIDLVGGMLYQDIIAVMNLIRMQADSTHQEDLIEQGFEIFWNGIKR